MSESDVTNGVSEDELDSADDRELLRGQSLGRYLLLGKLGSGNMGVVYAAYDPELDRRVALKLLAAQEADFGGRGRARLLREAQALARLSHPNVVAIHDVGVHDDRVWIAMELVAGVTLRAWRAERRRSWSEILRVLIEVARGVAAAHAVGLVHRDLKPDNVMVGVDGRVRVMDFGLAHGRAPAAVEAMTSSEIELRPEVAALELRLTQAGALLGTPAYMAPEQWLGEDVEAPADQFAWGVMAWETLYGQRPFAGETKLALATAVTRGLRVAPKRGRRVPRWLREAVERTLAPAPTQRWPTMAALLPALERGQTRARARAAGLVLSCVAALGAGVVGYRRWDANQRIVACEQAGASVDAGWNDAIRRSTREAIAATQVTRHEELADRFVALLDRQVGRQRAVRTAVCLDASAGSAASAQGLARSLWCLDEDRMELDALVAEAARAEPASVHRLLPAALNLSDSERCRDPRSLPNLVPPAGTDRADVQRVHAELSRVTAAERMGKADEALTGARANVARAERIAWPPLLAAARLQLATLLRDRDDYRRAEHELVDVYFGALRGESPELALAASRTLAMLLADGMGRAQEGSLWLRLAEAALAGFAGEHDLHTAEYRTAEAYVALATGDFVRAKWASEQAVALTEAALGPDHPHLGLSMTGAAYVHEKANDLEAADALLERGVALLERTLGPQHPDVAVALNHLGIRYWQRGESSRGKPLLERALSIREAYFGPDHSDTADSLANLATLAVAGQDYATAKPLYERALVIHTARAREGAPLRSELLLNLGVIHQMTGDLESAASYYERAWPLEEKESRRDPGHGVAVSLANLAELRRSTGQLAEAERLFQQVLAMRRYLLGPDHPELALPLANLAALTLARGRVDDARALAERAIALYDRDDASVGESAEVRFVLARTLADQDRDRALALANQAREIWGSQGDPAALAEVEAWIARHGHE